jgi:hypothetical protein
MLQPQGRPRGLAGGKMHRAGGVGSATHPHRSLCSLRCASTRFNARGSGRCSPQQMVIRATTCATPHGIAIKDVEALGRTGRRCLRRGDQDLAYTK